MKDKKRKKCYYHEKLDKEKQRAEKLIIEYERLRREIIEELRRRIAEEKKKKNREE